MITPGSWWQSGPDRQHLVIAVDKETVTYYDLYQTKKGLAAFSWDTSVMQWEMDVDLGRLKKIRK